ncbi:MAG TPA: aspartate kinase, partial [Bacteroidota bacterium]|nr:aspartate kinase [Bacteroidota bacterium]
GELTPRTKDSFYSYGELLSSRIVAAVLNEEGIEAQWIDTKEFMITDENFNSAMPRMEIVSERLPAIVDPLIKKRIVPVTQGFIGSTPSGRRTTMGRESSDYSAAVIGAVVNADDIEIWTDVDGVLSADPRVVGSPLKVKVLTFDEAYELSFFGAKVLHPNTMLPAIEKNIPIHVYNSRRPERSGTSVMPATSAAVASSRPVVKSVAYKKNIVVISVKPSKRFSQFIFWEHLTSILTKHGVEVSLSASSEYNIVFAFDRKYYTESIMHEMSNLGLVEVLTGKAILCLVGMNIQSDHELLKKLFASIEPAAASMVSFGATSSSVSLVVDEEHVLDAVKRLHSAFFPANTRNEIFESLG